MYIHVYTYSWEDTHFMSFSDNYTRKFRRSIFCLSSNPNPRGSYLSHCLLTAHANLIPAKAVAQYTINVDICVHILCYMYVHDARDAVVWFDTADCIFP